MASGAQPPPATAAVHIRDVEGDLDICEANVRGACPDGPACQYHHCPMPYLWQMRSHTGWVSLWHESQAIETKFCTRDMVCSIKLHQESTQRVYSDMMLDFNQMKANLSNPTGPQTDLMVNVRRLSTPSYATIFDKNNLEATDSEVKYCTQWRWYWCCDEWKKFHTDKGRQTPEQHVLERKFLAGQEIFRFEIIETIQATYFLTSTQRAQAFLLNFTNSTLKSLKDDKVWPVCRRPILITQQDLQRKVFHQNPPVTSCPFLATIPDTWYPVDTQHEYEMIPLDPQSVAFHLVASEFYNSLPKDRTLLDIFRVQNAYQWSQYYHKKVMMQRSAHTKGKDIEMQLFHGTNDDEVVQAICRENFDWRVCGKNNIVYGQGSYFARNAQLSDKYTKLNRGDRVSWMFMARVLVGRYTRGSSSMTRPPPLDTAYPHGQLYDSCVDHCSTPTIFVIFDKSQCYPEYLIAYKSPV